MSDELYDTVVINVIGGPGVGKSVTSSLIFVELKIRGYSCELVQEYAKSLVWQKDFDTLNDQYHVSKTQFKLIKSVDGFVRFIVTDGPLPHGLYYNRFNKTNNSNIENTEKMILDCYSKLKNINIFLERGDFPYEECGRIQKEEEAKEIDHVLKHILRRNNIPFVCFESDPSKIKDIVDYIIEVESEIKNFD